MVFILEKISLISVFFFIFAIQMENNNKQRILWLDMAKGYGIIFVIMGHWNIPYLTDYLYAFHIPLFFFLSGVVFSTKADFASFFKSKIRRIIVPYFCLSLPVIFTNLFFSMRLRFGISDIVKEFVLFVIQERHTTFWFIACLFVLNVLMYPLAKYVRSHRLSDIIILFLCLCGILLWRSDVLALPWNIDAALVVLPFFYIGYRLKGFLLHLSNSNLRIGIVAIPVLGFLVWLLNSWNMGITGKRVDIFYSNLNVELLAYLAAAIGILMTVLFSMSHINKIIRYIGENSLLYFAWHQTIILPVLNNVYWKIGVMKLPVYTETSLIKWLSVLLTLLVITLLNEAVVRTKLKFVLGK